MKTKQGKMDCKSLFRFLCFSFGLMLIMFQLTGCFKNEHEFLEQYKEHMAKAKTAGLANDAQTERMHYSKALEAAEEIEWPEGVVNVLIAQARSFSGSQEYSDAETSLWNAENVCSQNRCEDSTVWSIYDNLFILYTFIVKDISKSEYLISKIEVNRGRFKDTNGFDQRVSRYKNDLKKSFGKN